MARHKNTSWNLPQNYPGTDGAALAALMDIRDELQTLVRIMQCHNVALGFQAMEATRKTVKTIDKRLAKRIPLA